MCVCASINDLIKRMFTFQMYNYVVSPLRQCPGWWGVSWWVYHEDSSTDAQSPPCERGASSSQGHSKPCQSSPLDRSAFLYSKPHNYYTTGTFVYFKGRKKVQLQQRLLTTKHKMLPLTDFRHAREANICLTREGLHMTPGLSLSMKISSSMSAGPNVQFLLVGRDTSLTLSMTWATATTNKKATSIFGNTRNYSYWASITPYHPRQPGIQSHSFWKCQCCQWVYFHWQQWGEASEGCKHDKHMHINDMYDWGKHVSAKSDSYAMSFCPWRTVCCCNISKLNFSSVACWSIIKMSDLSLAMMNPRLNWPMISMSLNISLLWMETSFIAMEISHY